jgi:hypothetical protein
MGRSETASRAAKPPYAFSETGLPRTSIALCGGHPSPRFDLNHSGLFSPAEAEALSVGVSCIQRVTQWVKERWSANVHGHLQLINDGAHPLTLRCVAKPEFVKLPAIFVILQPHHQLIDHVVQIYLLSRQTRIIIRAFTVWYTRRQFDRHGLSQCGRRSLAAVNGRVCCTDR